MRLTDNDLFLLCQCAISAAMQAGQVISSYKQKSINIQQKPGGSSLASQLVTEVDFLSQAIILQTLHPTCKQFDLALLSEEAPDNKQRLTKDYFWSIDPLDGTLPFTEVSTGYAVSIALVAQNGEAQIGIIYDPLTSTLYHAIKNKGAFKNGKALKAQSANSTCFTLIGDRSFKNNKNYPQIIEQLKQIGKRMGLSEFKTVLHGGAAMNACWVLENSPACYFKSPKSQAGGGSLWDYAASACIFYEAGAVASDIYGKQLDLNRPDCTFMNHNGIIYASNQQIAENIMTLYSNSFF